MGTSLPEELSNSIVGNSSKDKLQVPTVFHTLSLLQPLKAPKSYGTYSKQQQDEVIAFIKDGNSLRTAEKYFGIPKSTMHCWLKKVHPASNIENGNTKYSQSLDIDTYSMVHNNIDDNEDSNTRAIRKSPLIKTSPQQLVSPTTSTNNNNNNNDNNTNPLSVSPTLGNIIGGGGSASKKAEAQIIIEEAELIRFLQTGEGAELIGKAYNLPVAEFLNFVKNAQFVKRDTTTKPPVKSDEMVSLLKQTGGGTMKEETAKMNTSPFSFSGMRKRNFNSSACKCQPTSFCKAVTTDLKKPKLEMEMCSTTSNNNDGNIRNGSGGGVLEALLTRPREVKRFGATPTVEKPAAGGKLVLTEEQIKTSNKLISQAQPGVVNTYLVTVPLSSLPGSLTPLPKPNDNFEECELSPTYPKMVNSVSIKTERIENDFMMQPPAALPYNAKDHPPTMVVLPKMQTLINHATKPVVSTNAKAALNLNEINRTQSERELMALVDGDVVSADELCTDFNETLELNKWVHNENWYTDQYLQHFQMYSDGTPSMDTSTTTTTTTVEKSDDDFEDDEDGGGITFASVSDKDKIISFLSEGNSITEAVNQFGIPQATITRWLGSIEKKEQQEDTSMERESEMEEQQAPLQQQKSVFAFTNKSSERSADGRKSAFSRPFN